MPDQPKKPEVTFSCPECASNIALGIEEVMYNYRVIDPDTGNLIKKTVRHSDGNANNIFLFQCTECSWSVREGESLYVHFESHINKTQLGKFEDLISKRQFKNKPICK